MHPWVHSFVSASMHGYMLRTLDPWIHGSSHASMYASIDGCMHPCMHALMHAYIHACIHGCMHPCMYASVHISMDASMHASIHVCRCLRTASIGISKIGRFHFLAWLLWAWHTFAKSLSPTPSLRVRWQEWYPGRR